MFYPVSFNLNFNQNVKLPSRETTNNSFSFKAALKYSALSHCFKYENKTNKRGKIKEVRHC